MHATTGLGALLLGVLPGPWHWVAAGLGVFMGWAVFPLTGIDAKLRRPGEPFFGGLRTYPLAVLGLVCLLPRGQAAAAWGVLAFGDAAAAWFGSRMPSRPVFGHPKATWLGSAAYAVAGFLAAWGLSAGAAALSSRTGWTQAPVHAPGAVACLVAALAAVLSDLIPLPVDDNLPAALAAGLALTCTTHDFL